MELKHKQSASSNVIPLGSKCRKYSLQVISGLLLIAFSTLAPAALDRVGDFALLDNAGTFHQLSRYKHRKALVLMAYSDECATMDALLDSFKGIAVEYAGNDFEFLLIDSQDLDRAQLYGLGTELPILEDGGQLVSEKLNIENAGDVLVLNPERLSLFYKGQPSQELESVLTSITGEGVSDTIRQSGAGCAIDYQMKELHSEILVGHVAESVLHDLL